MGKFIILVFETQYFRGKWAHYSYSPAPLYVTEDCSSRTKKALLRSPDTSTLPPTKRLAGAFSRKGQLKPLRPETVLIVDQEFSVRSNHVRHF
jgi:hypothetical protein